MFRPRLNRAVSLQIGIWSAAFSDPRHRSLPKPRLPSPLSSCAPSLQRFSTRTHAERRAGESGRTPRGAYSGGMLSLTAAVAVGIGGKRRTTVGLRKVAVGPGAALGVD